MLGMEDTILERYYDSDVEVHVFARDGKSDQFIEFVRKAKLVRSPESTGKLLGKFDAEEVYHVPDTNSLYFHETFSDYDIVGTVDGTDGLIIYCNFCNAWGLSEVSGIMSDSGWSSPSHLS